MYDLRNHKEERDMFYESVTKRAKQVLSKTTEINDLPNSILQDILRRLPVKTILCCKCVRKEWNKLIKEPDFPKLHHPHAPICPILRSYEPRFWPTDFHLIEVTNIDDLVSPLRLHSKISPPQVSLIPVMPTTLAPNRPKFGIVNSCNGLLCVCTTPFNNPIYVCNPITGEYIMLPKPRKNFETDDYIMEMKNKGELCLQDFIVSGFGYSPRSNQYKVMKILDLKIDDERFICVQILTLGTRTWRTVGEIEEWNEIGLKLSRRLTLFPTEALYKPSFCVYHNGAVHWLGNSATSHIYICALDFDDEVLDEILPPSEIYDKEHDQLEMENMGLGVLHDCLYFSDTTNYTQFKLWVLKDYNNWHSWTKELVINTLSLNIMPRGLYQPIKYLDNGDLLMFHPSSALVSYNPKDQSFRYFKIRGNIDSDFGMVPHVPSLVSMKDVIKVKDKNVKILNARKSRKLLDAWVERNQFLLVEEDENVVSAARSETVEENT